MSRENCEEPHLLRVVAEENKLEESKNHISLPTPRSLEGFSIQGKLLHSVCKLAVLTDWTYEMYCLKFLRDLLSIDCDNGPNSDLQNVKTFNSVKPNEYVLLNRA